MVLTHEMERPFQADGSSVMKEEPEEADSLMNSPVGYNKEFGLYLISS